MEAAGLSEAIRLEFANVLKIDLSKIDDFTDFMSLGLDSILVIELAFQIKKRLGIVLEPQDFFEATNITELTDLILAKSAQTQ